MMTISKEDPSIILEDIVSFSYADDSTTLTTDATISFKVKTDGSTIPDVTVGAKIAENSGNPLSNPAKPVTI